MNLEFARQQMIDQQVRAGDVLEAKILSVLSKLNREDFVPREYAGVAFADCNIPLPDGQCMMSPLVEGQVLQALDPVAGDAALEIGTGSGFLTACLATLASQVQSIEISPDLTTLAKTNLEDAGIDNVTVSTVNALELEPQQKYDVIAVTASLPVYDRRFEGSLAMGGRLFIIVGEQPVMRAKRITRVGDDEWLTEELFETAITPMRGIAPRDHFRF